MIQSIELQVISKILTSEDDYVVEELLKFDASYYSIFKPQIEFIINHREKYGKVPDRFTFQVEFSDVDLVSVDEPLEYLTQEMRLNKKAIILRETFSKIKDLGLDDVAEAWKYIGMRWEESEALNETDPMNIITDSEERAHQIQEYSKQARIPTGFPEIDEVLYGGLSTVEELCIVFARTNTGKAQPLWSKVLTPSGWKTMGDIKVGDTVVGKNNDNGKVVQIFPQGVKDYYRVHFDDGTYAECCDDHLWEVLDSERRKRGSKLFGHHMVLRTEDIRKSLSRGYTVDMCGSIEFNSNFDIDQELDPYLLGVIIGDGGTRDGGIEITSNKEELWTKLTPILHRYGCTRSGKHHDRLKYVGNGVSPISIKLKEYGLMGLKSIDKFIPKQYLTAPVEVRKSLLAGLLDTDGYAIKGQASWEFDTSSEQLAKDFIDLVRSLGVKVWVKPRTDSYYIQDGIKKPAHGIRHIYCRSDFNPFTISVKADRWQFRDTPVKRSMPRRHCKRIDKVEYIGKTECQCIMVDNHSHTYITDDYTVTHNTWVLSKMMESAQRHGFPSLYYSPEMQPCYLATRFDSWRGGFHNSDIIRGIYDEKYQKYLKELPMTGAPAYVLEDSDSPSGVVDVPLLTHYVRKYKVKMLIIDGLSYMEDVHSTTATAEHIKFKNLAHDLFRLSKRYGCCVLVAMQANRETRNNTEKNGDAKEPMPGLHNIESSDQPGRICTTAIALRQIWAAQTMDMKIQKSRNSKRPDNIYTYNWDPNTGSASLKCIESASGGENQEDAVTTKDGKPKAQGGANNYQVSAPGSFTSISSGSFTGYSPTIQEDDHDVRDDEDVEF